MDVVRKQKLHEAKRKHLALKKKHANTHPNEHKEWYTTIFMEWEPLEFKPHNRSDNWYLWLGVITAVFITVTIITKAYIVAATFFLLAIVLVMYAQKPPRRMNFKITDTGIELNGQFVPYHRLEEFWILYNPPHVTTLHFRRKEKVGVDLTVEIENEDPVAIRDYLLEYLPEDEEKEEDPAASIARRLKF